MTMQTNDFIIGFGIAYAIQQRPGLVKADMIKLMHRQAELEDENLELRCLVGRLRVAEIRRRTLTKSGSAVRWMFVTEPPEPSWSRTTSFPVLVRSQNRSKALIGASGQLSSSESNR